MSVITIIIAAAVAAGISYALHIFDKESNSMEKVRKYADKRQSDFDAYFQAQEKKLSAAQTEIDSQQMRAVAAVKRLEQQISDFQKMTDNLKSDSEAVHKIEERISAYDSLLKELLQMTASVEENLEKVKKESVIIDRLNSKVSEQQNKVETIEKRIPVISQEFAQKNGEQLKAVGNRLLSEYDERGQKIKSEFAKVEENAKEALLSFQNEISGVYEIAAKKAQSLEDAAFEHLSRQAQTRSDAYIKQLEQAHSDLEKQLAEKVASVTSSLGGRLSSVTGEMEEKLSAVKGSLEEKIKSVQEKYASLKETKDGKKDTNVHAT